jgi:hypothetical protein
MPAEIKLLVRPENRTPLVNQICYLFCACNKDVLKVLSKEMDLAKKGLIRKVLIKERGADIFRKFCTPPILWEPFKVLESLLVFFIGNLDTNWNSAG